MDGKYNLTTCGDTALFLSFSMVDVAFYSTAGQYLFIETSPPRVASDTAWIRSQWFDASNQCMSMWYHMRGGHVGSLNVYQEVQGKQKTLVWSLSVATVRDQWYNGQIPLSPSGTAPYRVRILSLLSK